MVAFLLFSCPNRLLHRGALTAMNLSGETVVSLLVQLLHFLTGFLVYLSLRKLCFAFAKNCVLETFVESNAQNELLEIPCGLGGDRRHMVSQTAPRFRV